MRVALTLLGLLAVLAPTGTHAQGRTHVLIVVGLGGSAEYREQFHGHATALRSALSERHGIPPENITYLGERPEMAPELIAARSTRENMMTTLAEISGRSQPLDRLLMILIGHGTTSRGTAQFNLSGPDLTPDDIQTALIGFPTQTLALVHTGSASGGFIAPLSGPNRILVTATRTERERNATDFVRFFVEALADEGSDLDKDERVSLFEAFEFARLETARWYEEQNEILTEHAMLDDNGDGEGSSEIDLAGPDGPLAATFYLGGVSGTAAQVPDDPELAGLYEERNEIQGRIDGLRAVRGSMEEDAYLAALEELLVELALKNREIRAKEGGSA